MVDAKDMRELKKILDKIGEDVGIHVSELSIDKSEVLGFYAYDKDDLREFGERIIGANVIMENLSSDGINSIIKLGKKKLANTSPAKLYQMAAGSALMCILALSRLDYLASEFEENAGRNTDRASDAED